MCNIPFVRSWVTPVVIEHLVCMCGFVVHLGAQTLVSCTSDAHIQKLNRVVYDLIHIQNSVNGFIHDFFTRHTLKQSLMQRINDVVSWV